MINEGDVRRIGLHKTQKRKMMQSKSAGEDKIQRTHREKRRPSFFCNLASSLIIKYLLRTYYISGHCDRYFLFSFSFNLLKTSMNDNIMISIHRSSRRLSK